MIITACNYIFQCLKYMQCLMFKSFQIKLAFGKCKFVFHNCKSAIAKCQFTSINCKQTNHNCG
ncbi:MAG TPA: hypothetical protein DDW84_07740 [Phycisphaerales bacterium]|nr:MAG: hypothetical protein A2Y13_07240 [Planctomycetes bacterium GWC2_45_44]HBG78713.1 hypothetical protein [Phycisphaerales bacterium]HBR20016.1 hypothetical protein [Phycisphaerales bacterium]